MFKTVIIGSAGHINYVTNPSAANGPSYVITAVSDGPEQQGCEKAYAATLKLNPSVKRYASYIEMLDKEAPDIAVVAPYYGYNAEVSMECLRRGTHVFADKPVATEFYDLNNLKKLYYSQNKAKLSTMMGVRYAPCFAAAKTAVDEGKIGKVRLINAQKSYRLGTRADFYSDRKLYGGTIPWVGSHAIDWFYWVSGSKFLEVYASHSNIGNKEGYNFEVSALCLFKMENEIIASASIDYLRPQASPSHGDDRLRVVGTEGVIDVVDGRANLINADGTRELHCDNQTGVFAEFAKSLLGLPNNCVSAEDAFAVTEACLLARESADTGKAIMFDNPQ